jgi:hypothetical protein
MLFKEIIPIYVKKHTVNTEYSVTDFNADDAHSCHSALKGY